MWLDFLKQVIVVSFDLAFRRKVMFLHYHIGYGWQSKDYQVIWKELHKAHLVYARKLNRKYKMKAYDAGGKNRV